MQKRILIVEDDADLLEILRLALKREGFSIATARNGIEALKKARTLVPDLIVLDLVLPELDGFVVCETLRKDPATAKLPIIVMTGLASEFTRIAGFESGASDYVTKPFRPTDLVSKVDDWLNAGQPAARPRPSATTQPAPRPAVCPD